MRRSTVSATYTGTVPPSRPTPKPRMTREAMIMPGGVRQKKKEKQDKRLTKVDGTSFQGSADGVQHDGDHDGPFAAHVLVDGRENQGTADSAQGHAGVDETVLLVVEAEVIGQEEICTRDETLVDTREQAAHASKGDEQIGKCLGILEVDVERARVKTASSLELVLQVIDESIDVLIVDGDWSDLVGLGLGLDVIHGLWDVSDR